MAFLACLVAVPAMGQRPGSGYYDPSRERFGDNTLGFQLVPLVFGGYGLSYSRNVFNQRHWVGISPVFYTASDRTTKRLSAREKMLGFSVNAHYRYNYFELPDVGFRMFFQTGLEYFHMDLRNVAKAETHIGKAGLELALGFRQNIAKPLYFEFFIGYGQRWLVDMAVDDKNVSPSVTDKKTRRPRYDENIFGYGRAGSSLVIGLNLGFLF